MTPSLPTSLGWLIPVFLAAGLMLFLSSCGCCGERSCHPKNAPCPACFEERPMRGVKRTYPVNIAPAQGHAKGRVVLLLHELNGQSPGTLWLAKELADAGCKVYVPRLFGGYGSDHALRYVLPLLFSRDWKVFSATDVKPIQAEMAALVEAVAKEYPGRKITVIGSCMTGGLPLDLLPSEHVDTAIVCQPALPFLAWSDARKTSFGLPQESVARAVEALEKQPHKRLIQFNYLGDRVGIIERTQHLAQQTQHGSAAKRHEMYIGVGPKDGSYSRTPGAKALPPRRACSLHRDGPEDARQRRALDGHRSSRRGFADLPPPALPSPGPDATGAVSWAGPVAMKTRNGYASTRAAGGARCAGVSAARESPPG